jgi:HlyD family secretion protein
MTTRAPDRPGKLLLSLALLLGAGAAAAALWLYYHPAPTDDTVTGPPPDPGPLAEASGRGRIEPEDGVLSLGIPTPDRVADVLVREGDAVRAGQVLVVFDSRQDRRLEKELAEANLSEARKRLRALAESGQAQLEVETLGREEVEKVGPLEIEAQERKAKVLGDQLANARANWERVKATAGTIISKQEREQQELLVRQSEAELAAAQFQYEKLSRGHDLSLRLAAAKVRAARASLDRARSEIPVEALEKQVALAAHRLERAQLQAPVAGKVLKVFVHTGELVGVQPILQLANTEHMVVVAEVYETDIPRVRPGQKATVESKVVTPPLTGTVLSRGSSVSRGREFDLDPRAAVDNRVVEVRIRLDHGERVADLIGHQVTARIDTAGP